MKRNTIKHIIVGICIYILLLFALKSCESLYEENEKRAEQEKVESSVAAQAEEDGEEEPGITSIGSAFWYSIVTLTTVGYGDIVPRSPGGKLIGGAFVLASTVLVAFLISIMLALMRGKVFPIIRMMLAGEKDWYIFEDRNGRTRLLGKKLLEEGSKNAVIFAGCSPGKWEDTEEAEEPEINTELGVEDVLRRASDRSRCTVFCMGDNGFDNYQRAVGLLEKGVNVCCMTEYEPDRYPASLTLYDPYSSCARIYWMEHPVPFSGETIVLIGAGKYAEALLEQALVVNVFDPGQQIKYLVFGDFQEFRRNHPYLGQICNMSLDDSELGKEPGRDALLFMDGPWNEDLNTLKTADRIILCFDSEEDVLSVFNTLHRYIPTGAAIHARLSHDFDRLVIFGNPDSLFTPENVLKKQLDRQARTLHNIYLEETGKKSPTWDELSAFMHRSNIASADHLVTKVRILLGEDTALPFTKKTYKAAFHKWKKQWPEKKDLFRWIEHERWLRFHILNNWQYSEERDNDRRLHDMLRPLDQLSNRNQAKDDSPWKMLGSM